ncbi:hypothetical protein EC973_008080 [Apophysomyces ossiformis]|uniref:4-oxalomesaconate tautomerase n=1 Tax=Apophysomyces ossiformis TaxID=679940 RepID=A0A8H7BT10_9FUNG|nr:hypothetical protein EC973_008080 [Apophysomyces ossiformis]
MSDLYLGSHTARSMTARCTLMRGGTSRGPFFLANDLPSDPYARDKALLDLMGSGHELMIDGLGGGNSLTSKVAIISRSKRPGVDVDYLFAQVGIKNRTVDMQANCGNMMAAVGPFAIERGLVSVSHPETTVRVYNENTNKCTDLVVQTPAGQVQYDGDCAISGVPGTASPIYMHFRDAIGAKTGKMLPTGHVVDVIRHKPVSCLDVGVPVIFLRALDFGLTATESRTELNNNKPLLTEIEAIRREAGFLMGLGNVAGSVLPKVALIGLPTTEEGVVAARYFVPDSCHASFAVTGALCLSSAAVLKGTIVNDIAQPRLKLVGKNHVPMVIEHPSGKIQIETFLDDNANFSHGSIVRTARKIFEGSVFYNVQIPVTQTGKRLSESEAPLDRFLTPTAVAI